MSDAWHSVKIKHVELVRVDMHTALLRVDGAAPRRRPAGDGRPALVVTGADGIERLFKALPAPPDRRGVLRSAYSVPSDAVTGEVALALRTGDGFEVRLPAPVPGASLPGARLSGQAPLPGSSDSSDVSGTDLARAAAEARALAAERRTAEAEARAFAAEQHAAEAESRAAAAERHAATIAAEIEQRVAEGRAQARAEADARAAEAAASLRQRLADLEESDRRHEAEARSLALEVESLRASRAQRERELRDALDSVRKMTFERDELTRQAEAFDGVATKARERAAQAETAYAQANARLQELEIWRGELERRLAATTTELGAARTRIREDELELAAIRDELLRARSGAPAPAGAPVAGAASADLDQLARLAEAEAEERARQELSELALRTHPQH